MFINSVHIYSQYIISKQYMFLRNLLSEVSVTVMSLWQKFTFIRQYSSAETMSTLKQCDHNDYNTGKI